jgi:hypothetical protein
MDRSIYRKRTLINLIDQFQQEYVEYKNRIN